MGVVFTASAALGAQKVSVQVETKSGKVLSNAVLVQKGGTVTKQPVTTYPAIFAVEGNKVEFDVSWGKGTQTVGAILPQGEQYVSVLILVDDEAGTAQARIVDGFDGNPANIGSYDAAPAQQQIPVASRIQRAYSRKIDSTQSNAVAGGCVAGTIVTNNATPGLVTPVSSVHCGAGGVNVDNFYAVSYNLAAGSTAGSPQTVECVEIGIETNVLDYTITVNIYQDTNGGAPEDGAGDLVLLGTSTAFVPDGTAESTVVADFSGLGVIIPADATAVVEIFTPDRQATDGGSFFLGSSGNPADGPSYLKADTCGLTAYATTDSIAFPESQWTINLGLGAPVVEDGACCDTTTGICTESNNVDCEGEFTVGVTCADVTCEIVVPADTCGDCLTLNPGDILLGDNTGATSTSDGSCDFAAELEQWFCYTATCDGTAFANTCDSALDTILTVYDSCGGGEIACNDDNENAECAGDLQSATSWAITNGTTYAISVSGWNAGTGSYQITLSEECVGVCGAPGSGDCLTATGSPGCEDTACCEEICGLDPFCCDTEWDQLCADAAATSPTCTGGGGGGDGGEDECVNGPEAISGEGTFAFDNTAATTDGLPNALCDSFGEDNIDQDVWFCWTNTCPNAGNVTIQTCGLTGVDTRLAAYDGCACPEGAGILDCNDDTCGLQSLVSVASNPGDQHLIRVGSFPGAGGGPGSFQITCPIDTGDLPCDQPDGNCQDYDTANASQSNTAFVSYDEFSPDFTGDITSICWWGAYLPAIGPDNFRVDYYADAGGVPGAQIGSFSQGAGLTVSGPADTGDLVAATAPIYEYTGDHAAVAVTAGDCYWISIVNDTAAFSWFWEWSVDPIGNNQVCVDDALDGCQFADLQAGNDFAWCLNGALADTDACVETPECPDDIFTSCGDPGAGDCNSANGTPACNNADCCCTICGLDAFCCDTEWDQICADAAALEPVCQGAQGACCQDDGSCEVTSEDNCNAAGGSWLGEGSTCDQCPAAGRCCLNDGGCTVLTETACEGLGGLYLGDDLGCSADTGPSTTYDGAGGIAIPDGDPVGTTAVINVPDSFTVADVQVNLAVTHTWIGDICATLEHNGTSVTFVSRIGDDALGCAGGCCACGDDNFDITLSDDGTELPPCSGAAGLTGLYLPAEALSAFDGMDSAGDWTLTIADNAAADTGSVDAWSIELAEPASGGGEICPALGACCCIGDCFVSTEADCDAQNGNWLEGENCDLPAGEVSDYTNAPALDIPDGDPAGASDVINVADSFTVQDVNISVAVTHTWIGDICATVEHNGTSVQVISRIGDPALGCAGGCCACGDDNFSISLDDSGTDLPPCSGGDNLAGIYLPAEALSAFNGMDSAGDWTITIADNAAADTGTLDSWTVSLQAPGMGGDICENNCCGDGVVAGGEECDPPDGECCQADCTFAPSGTACGDSADGECTDPDTCSSAGVCLDNDAPAGTPCGNPANGEECFLGDFCSGGGLCQTGALETECGDGIDGCCPAGCNFSNDADCPEPVPTVSEWGLLILALLLAAAAKVYFSRRESVA
ncbi:MAG: proprotein convertase P-domain-containing protein [Phycisphaerae bacterium]